jgi:AAA domain
MDAEPLKLAVSGELGSGKSSVSALVAEQLDARRVSTGEAQRQIAAARGITTLELNRLSEDDPSVDDEIDSVFRSLAQSPDSLVVDSRLAWHFLPAAFKVHLVVDPEVGAATPRPSATARLTRRSRTSQRGRRASAGGSSASTASTSGTCTTTTSWSTRPRPRPVRSPPPCSAPCASGREPGRVRPCCSPPAVSPGSTRATAKGRPTTWS